ncbi:substrate-binding domain-containing protein [Ramlibacter monticola]|uniref:Molybdate ABC transporter substrate-binding protein n=1 Tax=Ramlibacter monticola TaxID=1926872 RepID=A0A936YYB0_9BURK|nr:molybdate ABC transporter substrate-binding protein [Ramlibacter monticola]MBL0390175.1 molybdate ABC transporter substrate-binding protein [Ramlibacter monticola]
MKLNTFIKNSSVTAVASMLGLAIVGLPVADVYAAELQVLAGGGMSVPLTELAAEFERTSGHKLVLRFGTTPELIKLVVGGASFDLVVVPREVFKDAAAQSHFESAPTIDIARVGLGVAVRSGAPRPDISTPEALKRTLLQAQSIATVPASAAGAQVLRALERLGIGEAMKAKTKVKSAPAQIVEAVAQGEAELGVFLVNVLTAPGLEVVGPFPAEVQQEIEYVAGVSANTKDRQAAKSFITYLGTPAAAAVIKARGLSPG